MIGGLLDQNVLADELLEGLVAFVVLDGEVDHMLQGEAGVANDEEVLEDVDRKPAL